MVAKSTNNDISIKSINTYSLEDNLVYELTINVINKEKLDKFIREIKIVNNVIDVQRLIK